MTAHLIDTNIIAYLADVNSPYHENVRSQFHALHREDTVAISVLTLYELHYSLAKASAQDAVQAICRTKEQILAALPCLPLSNSGAQLFGELKVRYEQQFHPKKPALDRVTVDLIIASTAITTDNVLVSNDALYARIQTLWPDFKWTNWAV
jgi:predicted nucleic acid-binding protein